MSISRNIKAQMGGRMTDRRNGQQKPINTERRKEQRRKNSGVAEGTPVRRSADWDQIDEEFK